MNSVYLDKVSDAIAHFVGLFDMNVEAARQKQAYDGFKATQQAEEQLPDPQTVAIKVDASHTLKDFDPHVPYLAMRPEIEQVTVWSKVAFTPPDVPVPDGPFLHDFTRLPDGTTVGSGGVVLPDIDPPGDLAAIIIQDIQLSDDDYVGFGGSGLKFTPAAPDNSALDELQQAAADLSPIDDLTLPGTTEEMATFVTTAVDRFDAFDAADHGHADVFTVKSETIEGTYLNGQLVDEADVPKMEDYVNFLKEQDDEEDVAGPDGPLDMDTPPDSADFMDGWGDGTVNPRVEISTGGNSVINNAVVVNEWVSAEVIAVMGDHFSLNAIVQINGTCDVDSVGAAVGGWPFDPGGENQSFNIAMFKHIDPSADTGGEAAPPPAGFPAYYVVTEISGDLLMMNWIEQYAFVMDNDVVIASSSGVQSVVSTGDNTAFNGLSLYELGSYYDLIIVGGNVYDASIICQLNLLLDNDMIGAVDGFETTGEGSASTGENLLWNQASIVNVGAGTCEPLPDGYDTAAADLAAGNKELPNSILQDAAFAGIGVLRVLYISGDIYNLQYIKQTTVVGDSDQVALAMNQMVANPDAEWTITTGGNQLVNDATIVDVDGASKIYVGGDSYSDEILIQANLVSSEPDLGGQDPDTLVNEAVAFLDDGNGDDTGDASQGTNITPQAADSGSADVMQHMLG
ncbi:type I secretion protein [Aminobacter anthyllidis]|uniref:Type I secretion protein n=1 Tax=Aminobacter anthyllidis TaxID=1035067 RepID=A0A9X1AFL7_9HYPH|nr:type I secretion protein [Aminobacter anthyllidis]MBT1158843.1 type I secretion protein [Aminobacter anthyllidis]